MTARDIIERALRAQEGRRGVRVKVRMPDALLARAHECARQVNETLGDWVNIACRKHQAKVRECVATNEKQELATRRDSEAVTVRAPAGMDAKEIRAAVLLACEYCESRFIPCTPQPVGEYILEDTEQ